MLRRFTPRESTMSSTATSPTTIINAGAKSVSRWQTKNTNVAAMTPLTSTVKSSGRRLRLLSFHSAVHSSLRFFFITIARRKGERNSKVTTPVISFATIGCDASTRLMKGWKNVNTRKMTAAERMP